MQPNSPDVVLDGCTGWFDGNWRHCCDAHDIAWAQGADFFGSNIDLAVCVAQTGNPIVALIMLAGVTFIGWILYYSKKR